ncbi:hypothetical protein BH24ACT9_BH24ACT9_03400 [soil metagenome]
MSAPVIDLLGELDKAADSDTCAVATVGSRVRLRPIPAHEPPLEDRRGSLRLVPAPAPQLALPLRIAPSEPDLDPVFGPQITDRQDLPEPGPWAQRLLQAVLESLAGRRSPIQLQYWTTWSVYRDIVRAAQRAGHSRLTPMRGQNVHISRVRVCEPADGVAEVCAVVRRDGRWHAVAARLEGIDGRWRCVSLTVG